jgi:uncharacterized protein DUF3365
MRQPLMWAIGIILMAASAGLGYFLSPSRPGMSPEKVAEHVHAIIQANRTAYETHVVDRMQIKGIEAAEHWKQKVALPLPAQFLIETAHLLAEQGSGIKYRLVSLWPIYVWNAPATDFERKGLQAVIDNPGRPYTGFMTSNKRQYFQAVYADLAVAQSCVDCHNFHSNSPRRDFKLNDVMGGIVITIPLEDSNEKHEFSRR